MTNPYRAFNQSSVCHWFYVAAARAASVELKVFTTDGFGNLVPVPHDQTRASLA